ncbi:MAG: prenyltransferase/squalene oxidase repeat-containing protein [Planctomycetaceae bacterium]
MFDGPESPTSIQRLVDSLAVRSTYASLLGHLGILVLLALLMIPAEPSRRLRPIEIGTADAALDDLGVDDDSAPPGGAAEQVATAEVTVVPPEPVAAETSLAPQFVERVAQTRTDEALQALAAPLPDATASASAARAAAAADPYAGRRGTGRRDGAAGRGGSPASEEAVERGLAWLARHQAPDGSWRFDLSGCRCDGGCRDPGSVTSTTAATGVALLPFLGAGHTQLEGEHRETVSRGLYYLMSRMRITPRGGDLGEGTMYGHGIATMALAEALGMTRDDAFVPYVRDAVRFIETAQDLHGGGWRYLPGQPGDTTVTAWQLAALRSAALAGVPVPSPTMEGVGRFLDRVEVRQGEAYGYQSPHARPCTSAVGLLCRLYMRWPNEAAIDRGLGALAKAGPAPDDVYLNFYLAQALMQRDHPLWKKWNARNRDQLVSRQARHGHEDGSWSFADHETAAGGRLAHTALAVLTLEVYYRLLPIYGADAVTAGW